MVALEDISLFSNFTKLTGPTLIKKKTKFSSYLRKFRWDQVQSHVLGRAS
jgi:hypothetical protein